MKNRMKDDESLMLGLSQQAGYLVAPDGMKIDRAAMISKKWYAAGWLEDDRESLTQKGLTIKGGKLPVVEPVGRAAEPEATELSEEAFIPNDRISIGNQGFVIDGT